MAMDPAAVVGTCALEFTTTSNSQIAGTGGCRTVLPAMAGCEFLRFPPCLVGPGLSQRVYTR